MDSNVSVVIASDTETSNFISTGLANHREITVTGSTNRFSELEKLLVSVKNPVIIYRIDPNVPKEEWVHILQKIKNKGYRSIVLCDNVKEGFTYLKEGATDMLVLPPSQERERNKKFFCMSLTLKIKGTHRQYFDSEPRVLKMPNPAPFNKIIAIGSSTGGTEAIVQILKGLPATVPPIVIVQHMPPVFTKLFAQRLNSSCNITVWEAKDGDVLCSGLALIAPGDLQMFLERRDGKIIVRCKEGEKVTGHCPSVDVLFSSVAKTMGDKAIGVILTGMGSDGAKGMLEMKQKGAMTIGQDPDSCIVYGMPKVAYDMGAVLRQVNLRDISRAILDNI